MKKPKQNSKSEAAQKLHLEKVRISTENVQKFTEKNKIASGLSAIFSGKEATAAWLDALFQPCDQIVVSTDIFNHRVHDVFSFDPPWRGARRGVYVKVNRLVADTPSGVNGGVRDVDCARNHLMIELDKCPVPLQEALWGALIHLGLPVVSVVDSGGKSLHAVLRVPEGASSYREMGLALADLLLPFLPDLTSLNPSRYTRLPGFLRGDKEQRLLYLNPDAEEWHQLHPANRVIRDLCEGLEAPPEEVRESMARVGLRTSERIQTPESAKEQKEFNAWWKNLDIPGDLDMGLLLDSLGWRSCDPVEAGKEMKHFIVCPWADEHGGGGDSDGPKDAYIFERDTAARFKWGFHCSHDCCRSAGRGAREVFDRLMSESKEEVLAAVEPWQDLLELLDIEESEEGLPDSEQIKPDNGGGGATPAADRTTLPGTGALLAETQCEKVDADLLGAVLGKKLCYVEDTREWKFLNHSVWDFIGNESVLKKARVVGDLRYERAKTSEERAAANRSYSQRHLDGVLRCFRTTVLRQSADFNTDPQLLGCPNGILDLKTGKLRSGTYRDRVSLRVGVPYDEDAECPEWLSFLHDLFPRDPAIINFLQRWCGYCLYGENPERKMLILHGHGCNGKSTLMGVIREVFGGYGVDSTSGLIMVNPRGEDPGAATPALMRLKGKRLSCISETDAGGRLDSLKVKLALGGDTTEGRALFGQSEDIKSEVKILLGTNHIPRIMDMDRGTWRRLLLLAFREDFTDKDDTELKSRLLAVKPGILRWAVKGCLRWQEIGLSPPPSMVEELDRLKKEMDAMGVFLDDCCVQGNPDLRCRYKDLYQAYRRWSSEQGLGVKSSIAFHRDIRERKFGFVNDFGFKAWTGLALIDSVDV